MAPRQRHAIRRPLALAGLLAVAIGLLAHAAPLTYDEAFNRLHYRSLGLKILTTYDLPNNHIPFTVLQALIPNGLLARDPWAIRIFGVASGIAMVTSLIAVAATRGTTPFLGVFAVAGSPLLVSYLFVSRGYTFSALMLVAAAALPPVLKRPGPMWGVCLGGFFLAVATWPLPTNAFAAPGWIIGVLAMWGPGVAVTGTGVYVAVVTLMFAPIVGQVYAQSKISWGGHHHWWPWLGDVFAATNLIPVCFVLVGGVAAFVLANEHRGKLSAKFHGAGASAQFAILTTAMCASWFVCVGLAHAVGVQLPLVRTAIPAIWIGLVALAAGFPTGRLEWVGLVLLAPAMVWGVLMWSRAVLDGEWQPVAHSSRNDVLFDTTPATIRDLSSVGADLVACSNWDTWVCQLATPNLKRSGVAVISGDVAYDPHLKCAVGSRRPPPPWQVSVYRDHTLLGVVCH
jgi:hypothetical protein